MRTMAVVVPHVGAQYPLQVACIHDQQMVEAFRPDRSDEPLGVGIGIRGLKRCPENLSACPREDGVKGRDYFVSRSRRRNLTSTPSSSRSPVTFLACWVTQAPCGWAVTPVIQTRRRPSSMKKST